MLVVHALWSPGRGVLLWAEDGERPATGRAAPCAPPGRTRSRPTPLHSRRCTPAHPPGHAPVPVGPPAARWPPPSLSAPHPVPPPAATPGCGHGRCPPCRRPGGADDPAEEPATARPSRTCAPSSRSRTISPPAATCCRPWMRAGSAARARWRPVVQGLDQAAVEALVATLPPVARAEPAGPRSAPPTRPRSSRTRSTSWSTGPSAIGSPAAGLAPPRWAGRRRRLADRAHLPRRPAARARGARPAGRGPARAGTPSAPSRRAPPRACFRLAEVRALSDGTGRHRRRHALAAGVPPAVQQRPQPARRRDAGLGRCGGPVARRSRRRLLLAELGRAARVYPPLARRAADRPPRRARPEPGGAHQCLVAGAALLVDAGFAVQLPAGWDGARRVGLRLSARSTPAQGVARARRAGPRAGRCLPLVGWPSATAPTRLDEEEIAALVAAKAPLVRLRGGLGERRPGRGCAAASSSSAAARPQRPPTAADVLRARRGRPRTTTRRVPLTGIDAAGLARRPARRPAPTGRIDAGRAARRVHRAAAPLPAARRRLAGVPRRARAGRLPGRRHGPGQDRPAARARVRRARPGRSPARPCCCARCRWSATGSARPPASPRSCGCALHHGPAGHAATTLRAAVADADLVVTTYATAARDADELRRGRLAAARARRGPGREERRASRRPGPSAGSRPGTASRSPAPRWRTASPSSGRSWTCSTRACSAPPSAFRSASPSPSSGTATTDAAARLRRITRPYLLRRVKTDPDDHRRPAREDRDHRSTAG